MSILPSVVQSIGIVALAIAAAYCFLALIAGLAWRVAGHRPDRRSQQPPVTILKPLCGAEPGLYDSLRSFCVQHYSQFQLVFGVREAGDPALLVVKRLLDEFPHLDIEVVVDPRQHGGNRKISNLINMFVRARHDVLVIADSDAQVGPDYLDSVTAPLRHSDVGLVTCIYRDVPAPGVWTRLGAMYINDWYVPSVLLAWLFGHRSYVSGQTIGIRRDVLQAIGGLSSLANHLADDHQLGELVRKRGQRIVLSRYLPQAKHHETSFSSLLRHEVRWMRTIMVLKPKSFRLLFFSFSVPLALIGAALAGPIARDAVPVWVLFSSVIVLRTLLHLQCRGHEDMPLLADLWLVPVRDILICWAWYKSLSTSRISWRGAEFSVDANGIMRALPSDP